MNIRQIISTGSDQAAIEGLVYPMHGGTAHLDDQANGKAHKRRISLANLFAAISQERDQQLLKAVASGFTNTRIGNL